jgi:hypothetical protein
MMQMQSVRFAQPRSASVRLVPNSQFEDRKIYRKTIAGHHEFERRTTALRPELRRLLIMIDGRRTVQALEQCVRPGELGHLIADLQSMGLVDATDAKPAFQTVIASEALDRLSRIGASELKAARSAAIEAASDLLGAAAKPYCIALSLCRDVSRLIAVMDGLVTQIATTLGQDAATVLLESMRDAIAHSR